MSRLLPSPPDLSLGDREPRVVGVEDDDADDLIAALSSETARATLTALHEEPATTSELADQLDTSLQNVQYHLGKLGEADLVEVVDTVYSEKGREMNVYAPADDPLVLFAGRSADGSGIKTALKRLLGGYGILGLAALAAQSFLPGSAFEGGDDRAVDDADHGPAAADTDGGDAYGAEESAATPTTDSAADEGPSAFDALFDGEAVQRAVETVEYAFSTLEPGVVFFLGAAIVFTIGWAYWYRSTWRRIG